jgi:hypothetical protein
MQSYIPLIRRKACLLLLAGLIPWLAGNAQSTGNLGTRTYDTTLTSDGFGIYHLQFPQFNPDSGTLVSIRISALTNTMYGFTLRDADSLSATYEVTVGLQDEFSGPALPADYSNVTSQSLGIFPLSPGQEVTQSPVNLLRNHVSTDTVSTVTTFLGTGQVSLRYQAFTFTNLDAANHASYYYSAGIANTMTFSVEYQFSKNAGILATDLTAWSAIPFGLRNVQLDWAATNEMVGREYVIQRGSDDHSFQDIASIPAVADGNTAQYRYPDELPLSSGKQTDNSWYYRLRIQNAAGQITYSPIRVVRTIDGAKSIQIYPNPATSFINVVPDLQQPTDWQVDIVAASGEVVQRNVFMQAQNMTVNFSNKLAAGTYFVHAVDLRGKNSIMSTFIVP